MRFDEIGLNEEIVTAIGYMGFETATPIQEQAIPEILKGKDLIACAQTGTGKTAAFILPVMHNIMAKPSKKLNTLVIVPVRELAIQIDQQIEAFSYGTGVTSLAIYGGGKGEDWAQEKKALSKGVDIVIATPGKLISHMNMGYVDFSEVEHLILDEADRMLDIGFHDDIMKITKALPKNRQSLMFSATFPPKIRKLAKDILNNPDEISIAISKPAAGVLQASYLAHNHQKIKLIYKLISDKPEYESIIIFSSTKKDVSEITRFLKREGIKVEGISSNLDQSQRNEVMKGFRNKNFRVLVATDVISRGIDIKGINLVINYSVPKDAADYVHRIGRTARADSTGVGITLINEDDMYSFSKIEQLIEKEIIKIPPFPELGEGPKWQNNPRKKTGYRPKGGQKSKSGNYRGKRNFKNKKR